jgi:hypothetical protein
MPTKQMANVQVSKSHPPQGFLRQTSKLPGNNCREQKKYGNKKSESTREVPLPTVEPIRLEMNRLHGREDGVNSPAGINRRFHRAGPVFR